MEVSSLPRDARGPLLAISRFGVAARAVILSVAGVFLVRAGIRADPSEAHNTRESMLELAGAFQGRWLLLAIALGLLAYVVDQGLQARCRRIRSPIGGPALRGASCDASIPSAALCASRSAVESSRCFSTVRQCRKLSQRPRSLRWASATRPVWTARNSIRPSWK